MLTAASLLQALSDLTSRDLRLARIVTGWAAGARRGRQPDRGD